MDCELVILEVVVVGWVPMNREGSLNQDGTVKHNDTSVPRSNSQVEAPTGKKGKGRGCDGSLPPYLEVVGVIKSVVARVKSDRGPKRLRGRGTPAVAEPCSCS